MTSQFQKHQNRLILILAGSVLCMILAYLTGLRPLAIRAKQLDEPLLQKWWLLSQSTQPQSSTNSSNPSPLITATPNELKEFETLSILLHSRLNIPQETRQRMAQPFQLVEYQNVRQSLWEEISQKASESKVTLAPSIEGNFPSFTTNMVHSSLLWYQLDITQQCLLSLIQLKIAHIQQWVPHPIPNPTPSPTSTPFTSAPLLPEFQLIPLRFNLELEGPLDRILPWLESLPKTPSELTQTNLWSPEKIPLFIHHFLLRKTSPSDPNAASLFLEVGTYYQLDTSK